MWAIKMEIRDLFNYLQQNLNINNIEIEDYFGNTIANLKDLDIADIEKDVLRLQLNIKKENLDY